MHSGVSGSASPHCRFLELAVAAATGSELNADADWTRPTTLAIASSAASSADIESTSASFKRFYCSRLGTWTMGARTHGNGCKRGSHNGTWLLRRHVFLCIYVGVIQLYIQLATVCSS